MRKPNTGEGGRPGRALSGLQGVALGVLVLLAGSALVPRVQEQMVQYRLANEVQRFTTDFSSARDYARAHQLRVVLCVRKPGTQQCADDGNWHQGWVAMAYRPASATELPVDSLANNQAGTRQQPMGKTNEDLPGNAPKASSQVAVIASGPAAYQPADSGGGAAAGKSPAPGTVTSLRHELLFETSGWPSGDLFRPVMGTWSKIVIGPRGELEGTPGALLTLLARPSSGQSGLLRCVRINGLGTVLVDDRESGCR